MKGYLWIYTEDILRKTDNGIVGINIFAGKQQTIKPILAVVRAQSGDDAGGTSGTTISFKTDDGSISKLVEDETDGHLFLPNEDYLSSFKKSNLEQMLLVGNDVLRIYRTHITHTTGFIRIEVRAILSIYARPTLTYVDATKNERYNVTIYQNKIRGVIE